MHSSHISVFENVVELHTASHDYHDTSSDPLPRGTGDEQLEGSLKFEDLDTTGLQHVAFPYDWGPEVFRPQTGVDGVVHDLTQTLCDAPMRLRYSDRQRVLRAHVVCI
jgi:hypothetical protein